MKQKNLLDVYISCAEGHFSRFGSPPQTPAAYLPFGCRILNGYCKRHPQRPLEKHPPAQLFQRLLVIIGLIFFVAGCAGVDRAPRYPTAVTPEVQKAYNEAESLYHSRRFSEADRAYKIFIDSFGYNALTDNARFKRGEISFQSQNYDEALRLYRLAYSNIYSPTISPRAQFKAAYSLYKLNNFNEAAQEIVQIRRQDVSPVLRIRADSLGVLAAKRGTQKEYPAIRFYLFLLDDWADLGANRSALDGVSDIISEQDAILEVTRWINNDQVSSAEVAILPLKEYKGKRSGGYSAFKYAKALYHEGNFNKANKGLREYTSAYPKHEYYSAALALLGEAGVRSGKAASVKVGLILPLSGKYKIYGESVLHGVECAAGVFSPCVSDAEVTLIIRDSEGKLERAVEAVDELASLDVLAIIGPILSATVEAAAHRAQQLQVPLISMSQRSGFSEIGSYIFRNTVSAKSQVDSIVDYAIGRKNLRRFLILYPRSQQGKNYKDLFSEAVNQLGGHIVSANSYASSRIEFATDLRSMPIGAGYPQNYDAIFIPDAFGPAAYIATTLTAMGVEEVSLLGISRWDDPRLVTLGGENVEGAVFPEAFYINSDLPQTRTFVTHFKQTYGIEPTLLEALGYDSIKMIIDAVKKGASQRGTLRDGLERLVGFQGVTGQISFTTQRDAIRELPLLTVTNGEIRPLSN